MDRAREAIAGAAIVISQCEILPETLDHVIALGAELGKPVMLNLAPARPVSAASLARLAYLSVNETEAEFLTGLKVESERDVEAAAEALLAKGPKTVVLTLGARGAYVAGDGVQRPRARLRGRRPWTRRRPATSTAARWRWPSSRAGPCSRPFASRTRPRRSR